MDRCARTYTPACSTAQPTINAHSNLQVMKGMWPPAASRQGALRQYLCSHLRGRPTGHFPKLASSGMRAANFLTVKIKEKPETEQASIPFNGAADWSVVYNSQLQS